MDVELMTLAEQLGVSLRHAGLRLTTAESCTGGWIAKVVTDVPGSSDWFEQGFVTYSNCAKCKILGVKSATLERAGAVSELTAREMAMGALHQSVAAVALAVTGIAGPGGGSADKPVGTVWFAWAWPGDDVRSLCCRFHGDREAVRRQTVVTALGKVVNELGSG